jgi:uncharacterized protein with HEPN domain
MSESDRIRVQHMVDAAREALTFVRGRGKDDLRTNRMLALSLIKEIEIIGEAASKVSPELKLTMRRSRGLISTACGIGSSTHTSEVDFDILWDTVSSALDPLIRQLETVLERAD